MGSVPPRNATYLFRPPGWSYPTLCRPVDQKSIHLATLGRNNNCGWVPPRADDCYLIIIKVKLASDSTTRKLAMTAFHVELRLSMQHRGANFKMASVEVWRNGCRRKYRDVLAVIGDNEGWCIGKSVVEQGWSDWMI